MSGAKARGDVAIWRPILLATVISGSLDILLAMGLTVAYGRAIPDMLRYVASGPFPAAADLGGSGAVLGLIVHFALMSIMATGFMLMVRARPALLDAPWRTALAFGLLTYFIMNWLVVPLRFGTPLPPKTMSIVTQLFAHVVLVGMMFALVARRTLGPSRT